MEATWKAAQPVAQRHVGHKHYELTDHLGNVRVVVSDMKLSSLGVNNEPSAFSAEVVARTDYYAFGSPMPKRNYPGNAGSSRGFNGMMKDDEIHGNDNSYDFGARMQDPRIGRLTSIDAFASAYPGESPYSFVGNSPISQIECGGNFRISAALAAQYPQLVAALNALSNMVDNAFQTDAQILANPLIGQFIRDAGLTGSRATLATRVQSILLSGQGPYLHVHTEAQVPQGAGVTIGNQNGVTPNNVPVGLMQELLDATNGVGPPNGSRIASLNGDPTAALFGLWETLLHEGVHVAALAFTRVNEQSTPGMELGNQYENNINPLKMGSMPFDNQLPGQSQLTRGDMGFPDASSHPFQLDRHSVGAFFSPGGAAGAGASSPISPMPPRGDCVPGRRYSDPIQL